MSQSQRCNLKGDPISNICSRIALPVRSPSPRKRLYLKFPNDNDENGYSGGHDNDDDVDDDGEDSGESTHSLKLNKVKP